MSSSELTKAKCAHPWDFTNNNDTFVCVCGETVGTPWRLRSKRRTLAILDAAREADKTVISGPAKGLLTRIIETAEAQMADGYNV